jgi:mannitol-1-phosphate 5-dehydrogenase
LKKLLLFGAGKIGRSFIGAIFSRGGYEVIFVDINREIIEQLNRRRSYQLIIKSDEGDKIQLVKNVRGIHTSQTEDIYNEITETSLMATSVGPTNLPTVIQMIGEGLKKKFAGSKNSKVDIILAENLRNAAGFFFQSLTEFLPEKTISDRVGLVETSIGKMVPIMSREDISRDILQVFAEPYNTLILDKKGFKNPLPAVNELAPKANMKAWVDRKSFIHNLGHAATAYFGYLKYPDRPYLYQVLADKEVYHFAMKTMKESSEILISIYPAEFTSQNLQDHILDLLQRFRNRSLGDTVHRVGRDLFRKLGPEDRLAGAVRLAIKTNNSYDRILYALLSGFYFKAPDEEGKLFPSDEKFIKLVQQEGIEKILEKVCNFNKTDHPEVYHKARDINRSIIKKFII